jgi:hypothetical protein
MMSDDPLASSQRTLDAVRERRRRQELGPPLSLTDLDLQTFSSVGPADAPMAEAMVRDAAGRRGVDLWNATRGG